MIDIIYNLPPVFANLLQPWHLLIVLAVIILFFGGTKIPELMKGIGKGVGEFKKGVDEGKAGDDPADKNSG